MSNPRGFDRLRLTPRKAVFIRASLLQQKGARPLVSSLIALPARRRSRTHGRVTGGRFSAGKLQGRRRLPGSGQVSQDQYSRTAVRAVSELLGAFRGQRPLGKATSTPPLPSQWRGSCSLVATSFPAEGAARDTTIEGRVNYRMTKVRCAAVRGIARP